MEKGSWIRRSFDLQNTFLKAQTPWKSSQFKGQDGGVIGLVVKGKDSCSEGCGIESRHRLLDEYFHTNLL